NLSLFDLEQIKQQEPQKLDENLSLFDLEQIKQQELNKQNKNQSDQISEYEEEENDEILFAPLFPDMTLFQSQQNQPEGFIGSETENTTPDAVAIAEKVENQFKGLSIDGVGDGNEIIIKANGIPEDYNISIKDIGNNNKIILNFVATPTNEKEQSQQEEIVKEPEEADIDPTHEEKKEPEPEPRYEPEELKKGSSPSKPFNKPSDGKLLRSFMENFLLPSGVFLALIVIGGASLPLTPILASCVVASGFGMYLFNKNIAAGAMHALQLPGKPLRMLQNLAKNHQSKKEKFLAQEMEYRQTQESQFEKDCKKYLSPEEQRTFSKEDKEIAVAIKKQQEAKPIIIPKDSPKELPSTKNYNDTIYNPGDIPQKDLSTDNDGKKYTVKKDLLASLLKGEGHIFHDDHLFGGGNLHSSNKWKLTEDGIKRQSTMEKGK
ncbi:MAG: hypothetical protein PHI76_00400, partial [Clostridia bacterium]|nr:hypothetical protein [Clostridia bacterium]